MPKKKSRPPWSLPPEEIPELIRDVFAGMESEGYEKYRHPRKKLKADDCRTMKDVVRLVFDLVELDGTDQVLEKDKVLVRWVWPGSEFSDRVVEVAVRAARNAHDASLLRELRLVATHVSSAGLKRLEKAFPNAAITVISKEVDSTNWRWSQADYDGR